MAAGWRPQSSFNARGDGYEGHVVVGTSRGLGGEKNRLPFGGFFFRQDKIKLALINMPTYLFMDWRAF